MPIQIRTATHADVKAGARLHVETWRAAYRGLMPDEYLANLKIEEFEQSWKKSIDSLTEDRLRIVAEEAGQVVGFVGAGKARWPEPGYDEELYGIYVHPSRQGKGIGRELLHFYQAWLKRRGKQAFMLWVLKENLSTRRFYEALGGVDLGKEKADRVFGVPLTEVAYGWKHF